MKFNKLKSGLFRDSHGLVNTKLAEQVIIHSPMATETKESEAKTDAAEQEEAKIFNAVSITSGKLRFFEDEEEIFEW